MDLSVARSKHRREDNMSMCHKYLRFESVNGIHIAQNGGRCAGICKHGEECSLYINGCKFPE